MAVLCICSVLYDLNKMEPFMCDAFNKTFYGFLMRFLQMMVDS